MVRWIFELSYFLETFSLKEIIDILVVVFFCDLKQPQIILLKEGTDSSQGKPQIVSNINACSAIAEAVRTTLGPRGMDKLMVDSRGKTTISNDGATILNLLEVVHPAGRTLVDIAKSQDAEVGDGTTSVCFEFHFLEFYSLNNLFLNF